MPSSIVAAFVKAAALYNSSAVFAFAVNMVASAIVARVFAPDEPTINSSANLDPGARITAPPAGDNKLPVIYGTAYTGGTLIDMSISSNNKHRRRRWWRYIYIRQCVLGRQKSCF